jgi:hypothetical protein
MSLHCDTTACGSIDGRIYWQGGCECGWLGERHGDSPNTLDNASAAHRDYKTHVEDALGAEAYYTANVACRNCGSEHEQSILIGTQVTSGKCIRCGTGMLQPSNDAWREMNSSSFFF